MRAFIAAIFLMAGAAEAHEFYSGKNNPVTNDSCCGGDDCKPYEVDRVQELKDEFIIDGIWHFPKNEALPSPDGQYHACIRGGKPRCFFFPHNV